MPTAPVRADPFAFSGRAAANRGRGYNARRPPAAAVDEGVCHVKVARRIALSFVVAAVLSAGCNDPYAVRQNAHRAGQVKWVVNSYEAREARCEPNVQKSLVLFDESGVPNGDIQNAEWTWIWLVH
jgi:hypothetical protein